MALLAIPLQTASATSDTTPPVLSAFDFTPKSIDTSSAPATITVTATITDDLSGFDHGDVTFSALGRTGETPAEADVEFDASDRISGTALAGTYQNTMTFQPTAIGGKWGVQPGGSAWFYDAAGNSATYGADDFRAAGFPTEFANHSPTRPPTQPRNLRLVQHDLENECVGTTGPLRWEPPANTGGYPLIRYEVQAEHDASNPPESEFYNLAPDRTRHRVGASLWLNAYWVWAVTDVGRSERAAISVEMHAPPNAQQFDYSPGLFGDSVGNHRIDVWSSWSGQNLLFDTGDLGGTVTATAYPDGTSVTEPTSYPGEQLHLKGLTNGKPYSVTLQVANACGSPGPVTSPVLFIPGVGPSWTASEPPLTATTGATYAYRFHASGSPAPSYSVEGPRWLHIDSASGRVSGRPPAHATSFQYSVTAHNGVGITEIHSTDLTVGPITVTVG
ncbi:MAG TPA: putative Ig domain-containing protein [Acidimicrobiia bacterium]|nr:putative Ig domain-containing protein [Acidimicrobiia bacterium]